MFIRWQRARNIAAIDRASMLEAEGWKADLSIRLGPRGDRTRVRALSHRGPLRLQRAFHPELDGTAHVYLLHPPGGLVATDALRLAVQLDAEGSALLTTPGATKIYRSEGATATIRTELRVEANASLEHTPQETIVFSGARARITTSARLARSARFLGWEIVCLGRPASGERFARGSIRLALEVSDLDGRPRFIERTTLEGGAPILEARWGLGGGAALGTLIATEADLEGIRAALAHAPELLASATRIDGLIVCRAIAAEGAAVRRALEKVRHAVRASWGRAPNDPAIWRT